MSWFAFDKGWLKSDNESSTYVLCGLGTEFPSISDALCRGDYHWIIELFAVSAKGLYLHVHGLIFETSISRLAGSTRYQWGWHPRAQARAIAAGRGALPQRTACTVMSGHLHLPVHRCLGERRAQRWALSLRRHGWAPRGVGAQGGLHLEACSMDPSIAPSSGLAPCGDCGRTARRARPMGGATVERSKIGRWGGRSHQGCDKGVGALLPRVGATTRMRLYHLTAGSLRPRVTSQMRWDRRGAAAKGGVTSRTRRSHSEQGAKTACHIKDATGGRRRCCQGWGRILDATSWSREPETASHITDAIVRRGPLWHLREAVGQMRNKDCYCGV